MGYAMFNLKARAGNVDVSLRGRAGDQFFYLNCQRGSKQFNKPVGVKAARAFFKMLKGKEVKVDRVSFSKLVVNYN